MSTSDPRATFTSHASSRIAESSSAPTRWRVAPVAGAAITTWWARGHTSPSAVDGDRAVAPAACHRQDLDAQRLEQLDQRAADPAGADDRHRRALELAPAAGAATRWRGRSRRAAACRPASAPARARRPGARRRRRPRSSPLAVDPLEPPLDARRRQLDPAHVVRAAPRETSPSQSSQTSASASSSCREPAAGRGHGLFDGAIGLGRDVQGRRHAANLPAPMASVPLLSARGLSEVVRRAARARRARPRVGGRDADRRARARTAAGSRRCCGSSPGSSMPTPAR